MNHLSTSSCNILHLLLQDVHLCIELNYINKIIPLPLLDKVPDGPNYLAGLMNIAGTSVPTIDLALMTGIHRSKKYSVDTPVVLCADGIQQLGIIVDKIFGLVTIEKDTLQMRHEFSTPGSAFYGTINLGNRLALLLNMSHILASNLITIKNRNHPSIDLSEYK